MAECDGLNAQRDWRNSAIDINGSKPFWLTAVNHESNRAFGDHPKNRSDGIFSDPPTSSHSFDSFKFLLRTPFMTKKLLLPLTAWTLLAVGQLKAQNPSLQCVANAGVPPVVRAEGITELVGDLVLNCTGGVPTQAGALVPASNIEIFLNTNITSRLLSLSWSEALLLMDEPHSTLNPSVPLLACGAAGTNELANNPGVCQAYGTGNGRNVYAGTAAGPFGNPNARPNVFQGRQAGVNSILFAGVPIDPPGTSGQRVVRITNIRANAAMLGISTTLVPTQITMFVSVTGSTALPINNPTQTVAFIQRGVASSFESKTFLQCVSESGPGQILLKVDEGFASSFKRKNIAQQSLFATEYPATIDQNQNVPGASYFSESGFVNLDPSRDPLPNPPSQLVTTSIPPTRGFDSIRGLSRAGIADHGTRLILSITSLPTGAAVYAPSVVSLINPFTGTTTGVAVMTNSAQDGSGGFGSTGATVISTSSGSLVYEILYADPFVLERLEIPITVSYGAYPSQNSPAVNVQTKLAVSLAPVSTVGTASTSAPIPRFVQTVSEKDLFVIRACNCNLLFPFVTSQQGYDTGIAIGNTSLDTGTDFYTLPESGTVTVHYYCGQPGCSSPASQTTNGPVEAGQQLAFTLSGGGSYGFTATPGFQGYLISQSRFRYCHGFAYVSALGAIPTANGASMGYLAIHLDPPGIYRPLLLGEALGH